MTAVASPPDFIRIAEAPHLAGLRFRHYRGAADHAAMAGIISAVSHANGGLETVTSAQLDADYAHLPNCDLDRDFVAAELDGELVGYGRVYWTDRNDGMRAFESLCMILPAARGRGIGGAILAWQVRRLAELRLTLPDDRPAVEAAYVTGRDSGGRALLESAGFVTVRRFCELNRSDFDAVPDLPLPDEIGRAHV